jgi:cell wall-associated NlpC family hydrolase
MNSSGLHNSAPATDTEEVVVRVAIIAGVCASLAACASTGAVYTPKPFPMPGGGSGPAAVPAPAPDAPPATSVVPGPADGYALSGTALSLRGTPYRMGGDDPNGFDCSGFVQYVYQQHGVAMPREVREQFRIGKTVDRGRLAPGDLVFFSTVAPGASHVGIVIGGDQFVHAPSERGVVRVETLSAQYWASRYVGAKRVN